LYSQRLAAHAGEALGEPDRRLAVEHEGALADVLGQVADALQLGGDLDRGQRVAQIHRHGLAQRQNFQRLILDRLLQLIDARVGTDGGIGQRGVAPRNRLDGVAELVLGEPAHLRHRIGQCLKLLGEGLYDVLAHRRSRWSCLRWLGRFSHFSATIL
jgi:hypothetical protein